MPVEYICDGCGKRVPAGKAYNGEAIKPHKWYARRDKDGEQFACSRKCIDKVARESGKTSLVLPI